MRCDNRRCRAAGRRGLDANARIVASAGWPAEKEWAMNALHSDDNGIISRAIMDSTYGRCARDFLVWDFGGGCRLNGEDSPFSNVHHISDIYTTTPRMGDPRNDHHRRPSG